MDDVDMQSTTGGPSHPNDLDPVESRVLGCLVEKEATTPDNYPLTLNTLRNACNQSTSRDPVMSLDDRGVEKALTSLRERGLTRTVHSTSNRATKYRHVLGESIGTAPGETALLAVLMLRGPQTMGELRTRSERIHQFDSVDDVAACLTVLAERNLVRQLGRRPGQKDARWVHLLSPESAIDEPARVMAVPDVTAADDPYGAATAEFYDLLATGAWDTFGLQLLDLFADVDPADGPIIDVGCGSGVGLPYLSAAVPSASIVAIEPSKAMRTALHARLSIDDDLRRVTTVVPSTLAGARLPESASALVACATLGHLDDAERTELWNFIATRMPVGAPAVIELLPPDRPLSVPLTCYRQVEVGAHVYEGWQSGEPLDDRTMEWVMTYKVREGDATVAEHSVRSRWRCHGTDDIRREIEPHGLTLTEHDDAIVIRRT